MPEPMADSRILPPKRQGTMSEPLDAVQRPTVFAVGVVAVGCVRCVGHGCRLQFDASPARGWGLRALRVDQLAPADSFGVPREVEETVGSQAGADGDGLVGLPRVGRIEVLALEPDEDSAR